MRIDALVVGAGPAGLYAAQRLARRGLAVQVLEEHERIGEPVHCTGIVGTEAFDLPGVPREAILGQPSAATFHSPVGHRLSYVGGRGEVCVVDRGAFDRSLAREAERAGAEIVTGSHVVGLASGRSGVAVETVMAGRRKRLMAEVCVLACGASYQLQRHLGWGQPPLFLGSAQTEVAGCRDRDLGIYLRPEIAPSGFGWLVPIVRGEARRAKVGVMAASGARQVLQGLLADLEQTGDVSRPAGRVVSRLLPLGPLERTYGDRVVAIGDAAGLVKPTTGGGIYYSLLSAAWASETIEGVFGRGDFSAAALAEYEEQWRQRLGLELTIGIWFRRLLLRLRPRDLDALISLALRDGLMPVVRAAARFNWHHQLLLRAVRHPGVAEIVLSRLLFARGNERA